ncbi:WD40 repeat-like protein [Suillus hirtellus]|nr:WD40 repeat-like protein [Suillus hirtellus]
MPINVRSMEYQDISPAVLQSSNSTSLVKISAMASSSMEPARVTKNLTLKPDMTLKGHKDVRNEDGFLESRISSISYLPDGKGMVSASYDKTTRQWDLQTGKEIEEARDVWEQTMRTVALSRDGRWVVTSTFVRYNDDPVGKLEARNVEARIVKTFEGCFNWIHCIDVSADGTLLVGGSWDGVRIWSMETGKLVAGPLPYDPLSTGVVRFSQDSKKFAISSNIGRWLEVWDVQTQKLDVRVGKSCYGTVIGDTPIFWTTKDKSIVAVFDFKDKESDSVDLNTIYEFDALTLEIVGAPFEGHTYPIHRLALSFDYALIASASRHTTKLWAFESRQLASFDDRRVDLFVFSPNSNQLAYTKWNYSNIYIYDLPPDILSSVRPAQDAQSKVCIPLHVLSIC